RGAQRAASAATGARRAASGGVGRRRWARSVAARRAAREHFSLDLVQIFPQALREPRLVDEALHAAGGVRFVTILRAAREDADDAGVLLAKRAQQLQSGGPRHHVIAHHDFDLVRVDEVRRADRIVREMKLEALALQE